MLHVLNFKLNLSSISKLTQPFGCNMIFYLDFCIIQDITMKKMIGSGKQNNDLYYLSRNMKLHVSNVVYCISNLLRHHSIHPLQLLSKTISKTFFYSNNICDFVILQNNLIYLFLLAIFILINLLTQYIVIFRNLIKFMFTLEFHYSLIIVNEYSCYT